MASLWRKNKLSSARRLSFLQCTLALVLLAAATLLFHLAPSWSLGSQNVASLPPCDYSQGRWILDPLRQLPYDETCADIFKGWGCIRNKRSNAGKYLHWRWQPDACDLPRLNPQLFLNRFRGKSIAFVGDSLNRNMYISLVCTLKHASPKEFRKWRPLGADKGITFLRYNVTVAYHRTNFLARYGSWNATTDDGPLEKLGYKQGYRVDVDVPQSSWIETPEFYDVLVVSTGHWWFAPQKFNPETSPLLFFENGQPLMPPRTVEEGLDITLKYMLDYVERKMRKGGLKFLRTQSPRHFEGGDWNEGGICHRLEPLNSAQAEDMFSKGVNSEARLVNEHLLRAASSTSFRLLNITHMSEFRADAHPSTSAKKLHEDCMHWCLPGVTDLWNDVLAALISESTTT